MKLTLNIELQKLNQEQLNLLARITDPEIFPLIQEPLFDEYFFEKYHALTKHSIAKNIFKNPISVICKQKEAEVLPQFLKDRAVIEYSDKGDNAHYTSTFSSDKEWEFCKKTKGEN